MSKHPLVNVDVRQADIHLLLNALKVAESAFTTEGSWKAAENIFKLHASLQKQIFTYEKVEA